MFLVELVCCLSACPSDSLKSNKRICMQVLPEVCLVIRNKLLDFGDDPDYDPDPDYDLVLIQISQIFLIFLSEVCLWPRTNPLNCGYDPDYDRDPD